MRPALRWIGGAAALALLLWFALAPSGGRVPQSAGADIDSSRGPGATAPPAAAAGPATSEATIAVPAAFDAPRIERLRARLARSSLRGAQVDGELTRDDAGRVRADAGLRRLFDHFLSLTGEFSADEIAALLLDHVRQLHGDDSARDVAEWFERYVGLRAELAAGALPADLEARLARLREARRRWFGEAAEAMFGEEEAQVAHTLARQALQADRTLTPAQREARLAQLEQERPAAERRGQRDASAALLAEEQTRQFDHDGTDAATRAAERSALFGAEAAQRLAELDVQRAAWDRRVADYLTARNAIRAEARYDAAARARALQQLLETRFDPNERLRIEALERIGALPGG